MNPWSNCFALKNVIYFKKHIESHASGAIKTIAGFEV